MKKITVVLLVSCFLFATGCSTTAPQVDSMTSYIGERAVPTKEEIMQSVMQVTSEENLWRYTALDSGILIEETLPEGTNVAFSESSTLAYYGYSMLKDFGVLDGVSVADRVTVVNALLSNFPTSTGDVQCRSVGVYNWNNTGNSIMLSMVKSELPDGTIILVVFPTVNNTLMQEAAQQFFVSSDGRIGASETFFETISTPLDSVETNIEKVDLTHYYLTDNDASNDALVLPVLIDVIEDDNEETFVRLFAHAQIFMYYLFSNDFVSARMAIEDANAFYEKHKAENMQADLVEIITQDLIGILDIAVGLAEL